MKAPIFIPKPPITDKRAMDALRFISRYCKERLRGEDEEECERCAMRGFCEKLFKESPCMWTLPKKGGTE